MLKANSTKALLFSFLIATSLCASYKSYSDTFNGSGDYAPVPSDDPLMTIRYIRI